MRVEKEGPSPDEAAREWSNIARVTQSNSPDVGRLEMEKKGSHFVAGREDRTPLTQHLAEEEDKIRSVDLESEKLAEHADKVTDEAIQKRMEDYVGAASGEKGILAEIAAEDEIERIGKMQERATAKREIKPDDAAEIAKLRARIQELEAGGGNG